MATSTNLSSADGTSLRADVYPLSAAAASSGGSEPPAPRGTVVILHGYCEHRGRYRHVAAQLNQHGYHVVVGDLRGHGESAGVRGFVRRFGNYLDDTWAFLDCAAEALAGQPGAPARRAAGGAPANQKPILLGHSMGGLIGLRFALDNPETLRALSLSSPFLGLKIAVPAWKRTLGQVASVVAPTLRLPSGLSPADLSHDPTIGPQYATDPLVTHEATARWFTEIVAAQTDLHARAARLRIPTLMQVAGDDRIVDSAVSQAIFERLGSSDKNLTVYPGLFHEIFNEADADRRRVLTDLTNWLVEH